MKRSLVIVALSLAVAAGASAGQQQPAASQAEPQTSEQPPRPFPEDARIGYIDLGVVAEQSTEGQAASQKIRDLQAQKQAELEKRQQELEATQRKLQEGAAVMNPSALDQLREEAERLQLDLQYQAQMANNEVTRLATRLQEQLQLRLAPIIEKVALEKGLHAVLNVDTLVWVDRGVDITPDVIKALDAPPSN